VPVVETAGPEGRVAPAPDGDPGPAGTDRSRRLYIRSWRIDLTRRAGTPKLLSDLAIAGTAAAALDSAARGAVAGEPGRRGASLTIVLTDDAELAELNAEHLGKRGATDVLSFPMLKAEAFARAAPASVDRAASAEDNGGRQAGAGAPERDGRIHLGDIAISIERAIEQAEAGRGGQTGDIRWSPADELRLLVTHGTLHICGWDHAEAHEEAAMRSLEQRLLAAVRG
jgi:probable rRNA maturation factor